MKLVLLSAILAVVVSSQDAPTDADLDAIDANNDKIIALANSLQTDLETEKAAHAGTSKELDAVLQTKLPQLQGHIDELTTKVFDDTLIIQKKNHRILKDDIIFGILAVAAAAFFYLKVGI